MPLIQLRNTDARIVYLAVVYHLGRPGSEIDPETMGNHRAALLPIVETVHTQLEAAIVTLELEHWQVQRLGQAVLGVSNELRQYEISEGRSMVPQFSKTVRDFWPESEQDPSIVSDLIQQTVMLRRQLHALISSAEAEMAAAAAAKEAQRMRQKRWWQVWKR